MVFGGVVSGLLLCSNIIIMAHSLSKSKGRSESGTFYRLRSDVLASRNFQTLSQSAKVMFIFLVSQLQYKSGGSYNNGDLCAAHSMAKGWGFGSKSTIVKALNELIERGWVVQTRKSYFGNGRSLPCLYALTTEPIGECGGKLQIKPTRVASNDWKQWQEK